MKKTLLLAALLLSSAAQADVYFCNPSMGGSLSSDVAETTNYKTSSFIIDTDKGFREISPDRNYADYVGNCFIQTSTIVCSASTQSGITVSLQMSSANEPYSFSYTMPMLSGGFPFLIAMVGTCTKA
jgi:hypothetical protein